MPDEELNYPIYPLNFVTGDTKSFTVRVEDPDPAFPDSDPQIMIPRILTGWTAIAQIRRNSRKDAPLVATLELSGFGLGGEIDVYLSHEESMKVDREGGWDLELSSPDGLDVNTILGGPVNPEGDYSR